jgi:AraC-like DNA-binding protein
MFIKNLLPKPSLAEFVRKYQIISWQFDKNTLPPPKILAPRPEHSLAFYIKDPQYFTLLDSQKIIEYPKSIICGVHNQTIVRNCSHDFLTIKVIFQPCAFYRITGIPAHELITNFYDAEAVFGKELTALNKRLCRTNDIDEMLQHIEFCLEKAILDKVKSKHGIDQITNLMLGEKRLGTLEDVARMSNLSVRQFIRKFEERTGVSPKMFDRIVRFDRAYRLKNNQPDLDWLSIALYSGYYDYQHLAKDYKDFTNNTPVAYYEIDLKAPERAFGLHFG